MKGIYMIFSMLYVICTFRARNCWKTRQICKKVYEKKDSAELRKLAFHNSAQLV